jgi:hypothetical protein
MLDFISLAFIYIGIGLFAFGVIQAALLLIAFLYTIQAYWALLLLMGAVLMCLGSFIQDKL